MHLHFVQSLETLQGAGLGQAALSLHLALNKLHPDVSRLLSTRSKEFKTTWPGVIQGIRLGPTKIFYAPELKDLAKEYLALADYYHGHGLYVWTNLWMGSEARRRQKPLVYHPQGFFDPWILKRSKKKKLIARLLFESKNIAYARWWRAVSRKEADQIRSIVNSSSRIHIIPNGIDLSEVDYHKANPPTCSESTEDPLAMHKRPRRLLFLSRIHPKKGLDLLVPVWSRLSLEFPDWELLIVGPDEQGYQAKVENMISSSGCSDSCWIHPGVEGAKKYALLRSAEMFVLPSYSEGFPISILEASAHRLPVIQTTECNFPELTATGAAWECQPEQFDLERVLRIALSSDRTELQERGETGRALLVKNYTWEAIAKQIYDLCL